MLSRRIRPKAADHCHLAATEVIAHRREQGHEARIDGVVGAAFGAKEAGELGEGRGDEVLLFVEDADLERFRSAHQLDHAGLPAVQAGAAFRLGATLGGRRARRLLGAAVPVGRFLGAPVGLVFGIRLAAADFSARWEPALPPCFGGASLSPSAATLSPCAGERRPRFSMPVPMWDSEGPEAGPKRDREAVHAGHLTSNRVRRPSRAYVKRFFDSLGW